MPIIRRVVPEHRFVLTHMCGVIDDRQAAEHVASLYADIEGLTALNELVDCRDVDDFSNLTSEGLFHASALQGGQSSACWETVACLAGGPAIFGMANAYSTLISDFRDRTLVSYSLDEILDWMGYSPEDAKELRSLIEAARASDLAGDSSSA